MDDAWNEWWAGFLDRRKLINKVAELDELDRAFGRDPLTEAICRKVCLDYEDRLATLKLVRRELLNLLEGFDEVHLQSSRIKGKASLIEKIIHKRYEFISSATSEYAFLDESNYSKIITDLVGIRLIINYRGKWLDIHRKILESFPLSAAGGCQDGSHLSHVKGAQFLAETPKVYYAEGDRPEQYRRQGLKPELHEMGYRSIHYIISCREVYTELQVRTIYDEAWSDCDHNYVYKQEANPNSRALRMLSQILCSITNIANDIGDNMHDIYEGRGLSGADGDQWVASKEVIQFYQSILKRMEDAGQQLQAFHELIRPEDEIPSDTD